MSAKNLQLVLNLHFSLPVSRKMSSGGATTGRAGQMTWLECPSPWLLLCFASVIVGTENKNFTISDR